MRKSRHDCRQSAFNSVDGLSQPRCGNTLPPASQLIAEVRLQHRMRRKIRGPSQTALRRLREEGQQAPPQVQEQHGRRRQGSGHVVRGVAWKQGRQSLGAPGRDEVFGPLLHQSPSLSIGAHFGDDHG